jgi:hypothetical protein
MQVKGYIQPKKKQPTLLEVIDDKIVNEIADKLGKIVPRIENTLKEKTQEVDNKLSEVDNYINGVDAEIVRKLSTIESGKNSKDGKDELNAEQIDKEEIIEEVLLRIPIPEIEEIDREELKQEILSEIPEYKPIDENKLLSKFLKKIPTKKGDLKIITEKIDPQTIIDAILKDETFKLRVDNIDGLENKVKSFWDRYPRGYLHGGGISEVIHDATLTGKGTTASPLSAVQSGGGLVKIILTGTVDGTNNSFTAPKKPTYIVSDGLFYEENDYNGNNQWTYIAGTITTVFYPQSAIWAF